MLAAFVRPLSKNVGEVPDVMRDEHPACFVSKRQDLRIIDPFKIPVLVQGEHVMTLLSQMAADDPAGELCVKKEAQRAASP